MSFLIQRMPQRLKKNTTIRLKPEKINFEDELFALSSLHFKFSWKKIGREKTFQSDNDFNSANRKVQNSRVSFVTNEDESQTVGSVEKRRECVTYGNERMQQRRA